MSAARPDPYKVLGVRRSASDDELQAAYRRLVQLHHPDHNSGSLEATRRFEEVQAAYAEIREQRGREPSRAAAADPDVEARIADIERELRDARAARERAQRAAREEAAAQAEAAAGAAAGAKAGARAEAAGYKRPSDEELGYVRTDDTFGKILADARTELSDRLAPGHERPLADRVADLLDEVAARLRDEPGGGSRD